MAEILYNEARGGNWGARAMVGWTIRDRAYEGLSCDSYQGAEGGALTTTCRQTVPCSDPYFCDDSRRICCVVHGGTTHLGDAQRQFNDGHVDLNTLATSGFLGFVDNLLNGKIPDPATGFVPGNVPGYASTTSCDSSLFCPSGTDITSPDPHGPMQYLPKVFKPGAFTCKTDMGPTCANAPPNNYFWGRGY